MAMTKLAIVGGAYQLHDRSVDAQSCINFYPQVVESGTAARVSALMPTPALTLAYTLNTAQSAFCRGLYTLASGDVLAVVGGGLYRIFRDLVERIGDIEGSSHVSMTDNGIDAVIVTGSRGYALNLASWTLRTINDDAFYGADFVAFIAGRFVFNITITGQFYWSNLYDVTFDGLGFATAEESPDLLVAVVEGQNQLWLFGTQSTEVHYPTGDKDLPYERLQGAFVQAGCVAPRSICRFGASLVWLANTESGTNQVVMTQTYQPVRISTHAIEAEINRYTKTDDAIAYSYQQEGHAFYVLTFPSANATWVYDATTQLWHQRAGFADGVFKRHASQWHCVAGLDHLVGDYQSGKIYKLDLDGLTDNGSAIVRERTAPTIGTDNAQVRFDSLELVCECGVGDVAGSDPQIMLSWSKDNGKTWSDGQWRGIGKIGEYAKRVIWRRLGVSRDRIFRIRLTDAARLVVSDCRVVVGK